jgi:hypothetical protein
MSQWPQIRGHRRHLMLAATVVMLLAATDAARAFGALAIDSSRGSGWGWSTGQPSRGAAQRVALAQCGGGRCHIVLTFWNTCGAFAADQTPGSAINGWGTGPSGSAARARCLSARVAAAAANPACGPATKTAAPASTRRTYAPSSLATVSMAGVVMPSRRSSARSSLTYSIQVSLGSRGCGTFLSAS